MILSSRSVIFYLCFCFCHVPRQHNFYCLYLERKNSQDSVFVPDSSSFHWKIRTTGCYKNQSMKNHSEHLAYGKLFERITQFNRPESEHATRKTCIFKPREWFLLSYWNIFSWSTYFRYFLLKKGKMKILLKIVILFHTKLQFNEFLFSRK